MIKFSTGAQVYDRRTGMRKNGTYSLGYDASGRLTSDGTRGVTSVTYDNNGMLTSEKSSGVQMTVTRDDLGRKTATTLNIYNSSGGVQSTEAKGYTGNGHVISKNAIVMSRFPGGFFDSAGSPYYYLTDFQGNNIGVYDKTGKLVQRTDYYASGEPWLEPVYGNSASGNRYLFGGKERLAGGALNEYDFEARNYVASFQRFTTIDPLTEATPSISPYAYCNANPVNFTDPFGLYSTSIEAMKEAMAKFRGAKVLFDNKKMEYYIALDQFGTGPYETGGTVTKYFGESSTVSSGSFLSQNSFTFMVGSYATFMKEFNYSKDLDIWRGKNGVTYQGLTGRGPNQHTGSRQAAKAKSNKFRNVSWAIGTYSFISTAKDAYDAVNNPNIGPNMEDILNKACYNG